MAELLENRENRFKVVIIVISILLSMIGFGLFISFKPTFTLNSIMMMIFGISLLLWSGNGLLWEYNKNVRYCIFGIFIFLPMGIFITFIHEIGHVIACLIFGWEIKMIHVSLFPFLLDLQGGFVVYVLPLDATLFQQVIVTAAGSIFTLIVGFSFFRLFYKLKLNQYVELFLYVYSFVMIFEFVIYVVLDVFFLRTGDMYKLYLICPAVIGILVIVAFINFILFTAYFPKIIRRVDL